MTSTARLPLAVACAALALAACHRRPADAQEPSDARRLKVASYDVPVAKAPRRVQKLETMTPRPQPEAPPASDTAPPASGEGPAPQ